MTGRLTVSVSRTDWPPKPLFTVLHLVGEDSRYGRTGTMLVEANAKTGLSRRRCHGSTACADLAHCVARGCLYKYGGLPDAVEPRQALCASSWGSATIYPAITTVKHCTYKHTTTGRR